MGVHNNFTVAYTCRSQSRSNHTSCAGLVVQIWEGRLMQLYPCRKVVTFYGRPDELRNMAPDLRQCSARLPLPSSGKECVKRPQGQYIFACLWEEKLLEYCCRCNVERVSHANEAPVLRCSRDLRFCSCISGFASDRSYISVSTTSAHVFSKTKWGNVTLGAALRLIPPSFSSSASDFFAGVFKNSKNAKPRKSTLIIGGIKAGF